MVEALKSGASNQDKRAVVLADEFPSTPLIELVETLELLPADSSSEPEAGEKADQLANSYSWFRPTQLSALATTHGSPVPTLDDPFSKASVAARMWDYSTQKQREAARLRQHWPGRNAVNPDVWSKVKLTPSEFELLYKIASGCETQNLASDLGRATHTVNNEISIIHEKLGSKTRAHAVSLAEKAGIILTDDLLHGIGSPIPYEMKNSLLMVIAGITDPEHLQSLTAIANHLNTAPNTIRNYLTELRQIFGVTSLVDIYRFARAYEEGKITILKNTKMEIRPAVVFPDRREEFGMVLNPYQVKEHIAAYSQWATSVAREAADALKQATDEKPADNLAGKPLTIREHEIVYQLALGKRDVEIATALGISNHTVINHNKNIFRKLMVHSRGGVLDTGFAEVFIEQSALSFNRGYSEYTDLFDRQKEVFDLLSYHAYSNHELANKLYITEQTAKNHVTSLIRKLGVKTREQVRLFGVKRREHMAQKAYSDLPFTNEQTVRFSMLLFGASSDNKRTASNGIPGQSTSNRRQLLLSFDARTIEEAAGHAIAYRCIAPEALGIPQSVIARSAQLTADQVSFLNTFGSYTTMPFDIRFEKMNISRDEGMEKLASIFRILKIPTVTMNNTAAKIMSIAGFVAEVERYQLELSERRNRYNDFINKHAPPVATEVYNVAARYKKEKPPSSKRVVSQETPQMSPDQVLARLNATTLTSREREVILIRSKLNTSPSDTHRLEAYFKGNHIKAGRERARALEKVKAEDKELYKELLKVLPRYVRKLMDDREERRKIGETVESENRWMDNYYHVPKAPPEKAVVLAEDVS